MVRHLYRAYPRIYGPTYPGDLNNMLYKAHDGSEILAHPNVIVHLLLAKFGPHWDVLQARCIHLFLSSSLEDNTVIAE